MRGKIKPSKHLPSTPPSVPALLFPSSTGNRERGLCSVHNTFVSPAVASLAPLWSPSHVRQFSISFYVSASHGISAPQTAAAGITYPQGAVLQCLKDPLSTCLSLGHSLLSSIHLLQDGAPPWVAGGSLHPYGPPRAAEAQLFPHGLHHRLQENLLWRLERLLPSLSTDLGVCRHISQILSPFFSGFN